MRKTDSITVYPWAKGLDLTNIPGIQPRDACVISENIVQKNSGSKAKKPGVELIQAIGRNDGPLRGVVDFHGTIGSSQFQEIVRVINGRVEALRNGEFEILQETGISEFDAISFERFVNALLIFFENSPPLYMLPQGGLQEIPIPESHKASPPRFCRVHDFRLFYAGRQNNPHILTASAVNNPFGASSYLIGAGASSIKIKDGDGDPIGITAISEPFNGDLFIGKSQSIYRLGRSSIGYTVDSFTNQFGVSSHNTMVNTQTDMFWVSDRAIHSLLATAKYGGAEEATVSYPIYEYFQRAVNWSAAKYMWATYEPFSNTYLLAYPSGSSTVPNKILGFNILTRQFFEWNDIEYTAVTRYWNPLTQKTTVMVATTDGKIGYLEPQINTVFGNKIAMKIGSVLIFPRKPSSQNNFTRGYLMAKPESLDTFVTVTTEIDSVPQEPQTLNIKGGGYGSQIGGTENEDRIGFGVIGQNDFNVISQPFELQGTGASVRVTIEQNPDEENPNQNCEVYGFEIEYDYNEDTEQVVSS